MGSWLPPYSSFFVSVVTTKVRLTQKHHESMVLNLEPITYEYHSNGFKLHVAYH